MSTDYSNVDLDMVDVEADSARSVSIVQVMLPLAKLYSIFMLISILQLPVLMLLLSGAAMYVGYRLTTPTQAIFTSLSVAESQSMMVMPIMFFSMAWLILLLKYGFSSGVNIAVPCFLFTVIVTYWPAFFRFGTQPIKARKVPYRFSYTITTVIGFLFVVGLNFNEIFI